MTARTRPKRTRQLRLHCSRCGEFYRWTKLRLQPNGRFICRNCVRWGKP